MASKKKKASPTKKSAAKSKKVGVALQTTSADSRDPGYVPLRTMTDSLEFAAIRYYLLGSSPEERQIRLERLQRDLMPIVEWLWKEQPQSMLETICPDGYVECHGCCVPYPCPD